MFEQHSVFGRKSQTSPEDVLDTQPLSEQCVDDGGAFRYDGGFEEVAEDGQDGVEWGVGVVSFFFETDARAELGEEDQVEDYGRCEQGVFAGVVDRDGILAAHHYFRDVFVHGAL